MRKYKKITIIISLLVVVILVLNMKVIRQSFGRLIESISVYDARIDIQKVRDDKYSEYSDLFLTDERYGTNEDGSDNLLCYNMTYQSLSNNDIVIPITLCENSTNVFESNISIDDGSNYLNRKIALINRFAQEYKALLGNSIVNSFKNFIYTDSDIIMSTPYLKLDYNKDLPSSVEFGMPFDKNLDFDWDLHVILHNAENSEKQLLAVLHELQSIAEVKGLYIDTFGVSIITNENMKSTLENVPYEMIKNNEIDNMILNKDIKENTNIQFNMNEPYNN